VTVFLDPHIDLIPLQEDEKETKNGNAKDEKPEKGEDGEKDGQVYIVGEGSKSKTGTFGRSSKRPKPLSVELMIDMNITVETLIDEVLKRLQPKSNSGPLNARKFQLLLAEEDGTADSDSPVLQKEQELLRLGMTSFVLSKEESEFGIQYPPDPSIYTPFMRGTLKVHLPSKEHHLLQYQADLSLREVLVKVCRKRMLDPDLYYFVSMKGVEMDMDTTLEDLEDSYLEFKMAQKSEKSKFASFLNPKPHRRSTSITEVEAKGEGKNSNGNLTNGIGASNDSNKSSQSQTLTSSTGSNSSGIHSNNSHNNHRSNTNSNWITGTTIDMEKAISRAPPQTLEKSNSQTTIGGSNFNNEVIAPIQVNAKISQKLGLPTKFIFHPSSADSCAQYNVVKTNKYGKRQERILGIDGERITNGYPYSAKPGRTTRRPTRLVSDIVRVYLVNSPSLRGSSMTNRQFCIEFKDSTQAFESEKAEEIVARINFVLEIKMKKEEEE